MLLAGVLIVQTVVLGMRWAPGVARIPQDMVRSRSEHLERRWHRRDYYQRMLFVRDHTPADALIVLPATAPGLGEIGNRALSDYFLFPRRTADAGSALVSRYPGPIYRANVAGYSPETTGTPSYRLDETFSLTGLRERQEPTPPVDKDFLDIVPVWRLALLAVLKLILIVFSGTYIVARWFQSQTWPGFVASCWLVGMTVQTLLYIVMGLLGVPASEGLQFALLVLLAVPGATLLVRRQGTPALPVRPDTPTVAALVVATTFLVLLFLFGIAKPLIEWDALAIWGIKARAIFAQESLRGLRLWGAWPEYPPLAPVAMAQLAIGGEWAAKIVFPLFAFALYGIVYEGLSVSKLRGWVRILAPVPLLLAPQILEHSAIGYANLALTVYVTWSVVLLARWLYAGDDRLALPVAIALSGVALARPDGEVYVAYAAVIALVWHLRRRRRLTPLLWMALPFAVDLFWKLFFTLYLRDANTYSLFGVASQGQQLVKLALTHLPLARDAFEIGQHYLRTTLGPGFWGLIPLLFLLVLLRAPRRFLRTYPVEGAFLGLGALGLAALALYIGPAWGVPYFFSVTFLRLYMVLVPLMYVLAVSELAATWAPVASASGTLGAGSSS